MARASHGLGSGSMAHYNYGVVQTPFMRKGQGGDMSLSELVHKAYCWRVIGFILSIVAGLSIVALVVVTTLPRAQVYFAGITPKNGDIAVFGRLTDLQQFHMRKTPSDISQILNLRLQEQTK